MSDKLKLFSGLQAYFAPSVPDSVSLLFQLHGGTLICSQLCISNVDFCFALGTELEDYVDG